MNKSHLEFLMFARDRPSSKFISLVPLNSCSHCCTFRWVHLSSQKIVIIIIHPFGLSLEKCRCLPTYPTALVLISAPFCKNIYLQATVSHWNVHKWIIIQQGNKTYHQNPQKDFCNQVNKKSTPCFLKKIRKIKIKSLKNRSTNNYTPQKLACFAEKWCLEDSPVLLGPGDFSGAFAVKLWGGKIKNHQLIITSGWTNPSEKYSPTWIIFPG